MQKIRFYDFGTQNETNTIGELMVGNAVSFQQRRVVSARRVIFHWCVLECLSLVTHYWLSGLKQLALAKASKHE